MSKIKHNKKRPYLFLSADNNYNSIQSFAGLVVEGTREYSLENGEKVDKSNYLYCNKCQSNHKLRDDEFFNMEKFINLVETKGDGFDGTFHRRDESIIISNLTKSDILNYLRDGKEATIKDYKIQKGFYQASDIELVNDLAFSWSSSLKNPQDKLESDLSELLERGLIKERDISIKVPMENILSAISYNEKSKCFKDVVICSNCGKEHLLDDLVLSFDAFRLSTVSNSRYSRDGDVFRFLMGSIEHYHEGGNLLIKGMDDIILVSHHGQLHVMQKPSRRKDNTMYTWQNITFLDQNTQLTSLILPKKTSDDWNTFKGDLYKRAREVYPYLESFEKFSEDFKEDSIYRHSRDSEPQMISELELDYIRYLTRLIDGQKIETKTFIDLKRNYHVFTKHTNKLRRDELIFKRDGDIVPFEKSLMERLKVKGKKLRNILINDLTLIYDYRFLNFIFEGNNDIVLRLIQGRVNSDKNSISYELFSSKGFKSLQVIMRKRTQKEKESFYKSILGETSKTVEEDLFSYNPSDMYFRDSAMMMLRTNLILKELKLKISDVLSREAFSDVAILHNELSAFVDKHQEEIKFDYSKEELEKMKYLDKRYEIGMAESAGRLLEMGNKMRICVGGYSDMVMNKDCKIVYLKDLEKDRYEASIEIRGREIVQYKGFRNSIPETDSETYKLVESWATSRDLKIVGF